MFSGFIFNPLFACFYTTRLTNMVWEFLKIIQYCQPCFSTVHPRQYGMLAESSASYSAARSQSICNFCFLMLALWEWLLGGFHVVTVGRASCIAACGRLVVQGCSISFFANICNGMPKQDPVTLPPVALLPNYWEEALWKIPNYNLCLHPSVLIRLWLFGMVYYSRFSGRVFPQPCRLFLTWRAKEGNGDFLHMLYC